MEKNAFKLLHDLESTWWYEGRARVVTRVLKHLTLPTDAEILDFGAGFGGMYKTLRAYGEVSAFEPEVAAKQYAQERGYKKIFNSVDEALSGSYDLIALFDVLEHIENDGAFLEKAHRALKPEGALIITVPALPYLWSAHDVTHHHFRRYTPHALRKVLGENAFSVSYLSFWNMILLVPAAIARALGKSGASSFALPRILDRIFYGIIWCETMLMSIAPLPIGVSLVALASRKK